MQATAAIMWIILGSATYGGTGILCTSTRIADGLLAGAPASPPLKHDTARAYRRYYERWLKGERFEFAPRGTRIYAMAAVRWAAAQELKSGFDALERAICEGDVDAAAQAARAVEAHIGALQSFVPGRRGRRVAQSQVTIGEGSMTPRPFVVDAEMTP